MFAYSNRFPSSRPSVDVLRNVPQIRLLYVSAVRFRRQLHVRFQGQVKVAVHVTSQLELDGRYSTKRNTSKHRRSKYLVERPVHRPECGLFFRVEKAAGTVQDDDPVLLRSLAHVHVHAVVRSEVVQARVDVQLVCKSRSPSGEFSFILMASTEASW